MEFHEPQALAAASQQEGLQFAHQAISSDTDVSVCVCGCASVYVCVCARVCLCVRLCLSVCVPPESWFMGARLRGTRVDVYSVSTRARVNGERGLCDNVSYGWGRLGERVGLVRPGGGAGRPEAEPGRAWYGWAVRLSDCLSRSSRVALVMLSSSTRRQ